jgi:UrcA family protein
MKRLIILALAALSTATPAAAARDGRDAFRATVSTAGLDLASADGKAALLERIAKAADRVCGAESAITFDGGERIRTCRASFFKAAQARLSPDEG